MRTCPIEINLIFNTEPAMKSTLSNPISQDSFLVRLSY